MNSLALDFPELVHLSSIGSTWENRTITLLEINASPELIQKLREKQMERQNK
jgi:hypothetical protein